MPRKTGACVISTNGAPYMVDENQKCVFLKKLQKKCLTDKVEHVKIIESSKEDEQKKSKGFEKKTSKKCLTERVKHDKIIKSLKQVTKKFFEN